MTNKTNETNIEKTQTKAQKTETQSKLGKHPVLKAPIGVYVTGSKLGYSSSVNSTNFDILSNITADNPIAEGASVVSTSDDDTYGTGGGIQLVRVRYFDYTWTLYEEIIETNGTTPVNLAGTNIIAIEGFDAYQLGTNVFGATGTLKLTSTDGSKLFAQIEPNTTTFSRALHFVPIGCQNEIVDIILSCLTPGGIQFAIFAAVDYTSTGGGVVPLPDTVYILATESVQLSFAIPIFTDASASAQALMVGIGAKGLAPSQIASGTFHFRERQVV